MFTNSGLRSSLDFPGWLQGHAGMTANSDYRWHTQKFPFSTKTLPWVSSDGWSFWFVSFMAAHKGPNAVIVSYVLALGTEPRTPCTQSASELASAPKEPVWMDCFPAFCEQSQQTRKEHRSHRSISTQKVGTAGDPVRLVYYAILWRTLAFNPQRRSSAGGQRKSWTAVHSATDHAEKGLVGGARREDELKKESCLITGTHSENRCFCLPYDKI